MTAVENRPNLRPSICNITNPAVVLNGVEWDAYVRIGDLLPDRPNLQLTYRNGCLEIMTLSLEHERIKKLLAGLVNTMVEMLDIPSIPCGSTTYQQSAERHGLEPDECFYFENYHRIRGLLRIDLDRDPPPDFVLEVDVTNRSIQRLPIYARMGVPEIWVWHNGTLRSHRLTDGGEYHEYETSSLLLPDFPLVELIPFVEVGMNEDHTTMSRRFRQWLKCYLADRGLTS